MCGCSRHFHMLLGIGSPSNHPYGAKQCSAATRLWDLPKGPGVSTGSGEVPRSEIGAYIFTVCTVCTIVGTYSMCAVWLRNILTTKRKRRVKSLEES